MTWKGEPLTLEPPLMVETHSITLVFACLHNCAGEEYRYWSGGYARCGVACLVCFALNGYHSETTYNWYDLDSWMATNPYPLLYTSKAGKYKCVMESGQVQHTQMFHVLGRSFFV